MPSCLLLTNYTLVVVAHGLIGGYMMLLPLTNTLLRGEQRDTEASAYHLNHLNQCIVKCHALRTTLKQFVRRNLLELQLCGSRLLDRVIRTNRTTLNFNGCHIFCKPYCSWMNVQVIARKVILFPQITTAW